MPAHPRVSIVMPVFNGEPFVRHAVSSICSQTLEDFEFLVIDDGSTDGTAETVRGLADERVRIISLRHVGLVDALNFGLQEARAPYIARMDADDVARSDRLDEQVRYLAARPAAGLVCSDVRIIDKSGRVVGSQSDNWPNTASLLSGLLYQRPMKPIVHPSVMMRREVPERTGGYRHFTSAEDRDFFLRVVGTHQFGRINDFLLDYRIHPHGASRAQDSTADLMSAMAVVNYLVRQATGVDLYEERQDLFREAASVLGSRLDREVLPGARAFREARSDLRSGRRFTGLAKHIRAIFTHGVRALPDGPRAKTATIIRHVAEAACQRLDGA